MAVAPDAVKMPHNSDMTPALDLVVPDRAHLAGFVDALNRGWSPNTMDPEYGRRILTSLEDDADAYLAGLVDRDPQGATIELPDGSRVLRLPQTTRWMWDGEFCGTISVRWQEGTTDLPPTCLGHVGYAVVPWKMRRGYATRALELMLPIARDEGLPFVVVTTDADNKASQRVVLANGGRLTREFDKPAVFGGGPMREYVVDLG